jgi:hypothetical protein
LIIMPLSNVNRYTYKIEAPWGIGPAFRQNRAEWGAIAVHASGKLGWVSNYWTESDAKFYAEIHAGPAAPGSSNQVLISGHRCYLAVAQSADGQYGAAWDYYKPQKAGKKALQGCRGNGKKVVLTVNTTAPPDHALWPNYQPSAIHLPARAWAYLAVLAIVAYVLITLARDLHHQL